MVSRRCCQVWRRGGTRGGRGLGVGQQNVSLDEVMGGKPALVWRGVGGAQHGGGVGARRVVIAALTGSGGGPCVVDVGAGQGQGVGGGDGVSWRAVSVWLVGSWSVLAQ